MKGIHVVVATLALSSQIVSAQGFMPWTDVLKMADTDGDGMVNPKEVMYFEAADRHYGFQPFMADHFKDFDTDKDGMVSMEEAKAGMKALEMSDEDMSRMFHQKAGFMPGK